MNAAFIRRAPWLSPIQRDRTPIGNPTTGGAMKSKFCGSYVSSQGGFARDLEEIPQAITENSRIGNDKAPSSGSYQSFEAGGEG